MAGYHPATFPVIDWTVFVSQQTPMRKQGELDHNLTLRTPEVKNEYSGIAFDGASRVGAAINITGLFCTDNFDILQAACFASSRPSVI